MLGRFQTFSDMCLQAPSYTSEQIHDYPLLVALLVAPFAAPFLDAMCNRCLGALRTCLPSAPPSHIAQRVAKSVRAPLPSFATTGVPSSTSARRRWIPVTFRASRLQGRPSEASAGQPFSPKSYLDKERSRLEPHRASPAPLLVRAEASVPRRNAGPCRDGTPAPVARLATVQGGPKAADKK